MNPSEVALFIQEVFSRCFDVSLTTVVLLVSLMGDHATAYMSLLVLAGLLGLAFLAGIVFTHAVTTIAIVRETDTYYHLTARSALRNERRIEQGFASSPMGAPHNNGAARATQGKQ